MATGPKKISSPTVSQADVLASMKESPTGLWTREDVESTFKCEVRAAENVLYNLYKKGLIMRHAIDDPESGLFRYAISINKDKAVAWSPRTGKSSGKKNRKDIITAKELRMRITQLIKFLSELEDSICPALDRLEDIERQVNKVKNLL